MSSSTLRRTAKQSYLAEGVGFEPTELALNGFQEPHSVSRCRDSVAFSLVSGLRASMRTCCVGTVQAVSMPWTLPRDCSEDAAGTVLRSLRTVARGGCCVQTVVSLNVLTVAGA